MQQPGTVKKKFKNFYVDTKTETSELFYIYNKSLERFIVTQNFNCFHFVHRPSTIN